MQRGAGPVRIRDLEPRGPAGVRERNARLVLSDFPEELVVDSLVGDREPCTVKHEVAPSDIYCGRRARSWAHDRLIEGRQAGNLVRASVLYCGQC